MRWELDREEKWYAYEMTIIRNKKTIIKKYDFYLTYSHIIQLVLNEILLF